MNPYGGIAISSSVAAVLVFLFFFVKPRHRFFLWGLPIGRTVVFYLLVADACKQSATCADWDPTRLRAFLLGRLLASGVCQDGPAWYAYVRSPRDDEYKSCTNVVWSQWIFPVIVFVVLDWVCLYANRYLEANDELYAGAILGTIVNFIFFWVLVKNETGNENSMVFYKKLAQPFDSQAFEEKNLTLQHDQKRRKINHLHARRKLLGCYISITFNNVFSSWLMYAISFGWQGRAVYAMPIVVMTVCCAMTVGFVLCLFYPGLWDELVSGKEDYTNDPNNITTVQKWFQALVPALVSFAYVFSTGAALQESGAPLAVCISVIPYVSFISMPIARLMSYYWPQDEERVDVEMVPAAGDAFMGPLKL